MKQFIKYVKLSGYKSIEELSIDFEPNLNILIGKNAVGKTNFINFLNNTLNFDFSNSNNFEATFEIKGDEFNHKFSFEKKTNIQTKIQKEDNKTFDIFKPKKINPNFIGKLLVQNKKTKVIGEFTVEDENQCSQIFTKHLSEDNISLKSIFIKHGLPKNYSIIESPLNIELWNEYVSDNFLNLYNADNQSLFFKKMLFATINMDLLNGNYFNNRLKKEDSIKKFINKKREEYKKSVFGETKFLNELRYLLREYSPIFDLRINDSFNIDIDFESHKIVLRNFFLEFFVDNKWFTFDELSDGTKRLFYIISEIFISEINVYYSEVNLLNIIFIEEPELGIHPHQLYQLMRFLKEKSRNNQIIITTHSPLSLDILEKNELDSIIIASKSNGQTKLKKLSKAKLEKAKLYMDDLNLSDFWLNSNLED